MSKSVMGLTFALRYCPNMSRAFAGWGFYAGFVQHFCGSRMNLVASIKLCTEIFGEYVSEFSVACS